MVLILLGLIRFQYFRPLRPVLLHFSHPTTTHLRIDPILEEDLIGPGIEEIRFDSLPTGLYLSTTDFDTVIIVVSELRISMVTGPDSIGLLATFSHHPQPGVFILTPDGPTLTGEDGMVTISKRSGYLFASYEGHSYLGRMERWEERPTAEIELIPLGEWNNHFHLLLHLPTTSGRLIVFAGDHRYHRHLKGDRSGLVIDSIPLPFDRLVVVADDKRLAFPFPRPRPKKKTPILLAHYGYHPGDTLNGVVDIGGRLTIIDPHESRFEVDGPFFSLPLSTPGRYLVTAASETTSFWVGPRGELSPSPLPISIRVDSTTQTLCIITPLPHHYLPYYLNGRFGAVMIDKGRGRISGLRFGRNEFAILNHHLFFVIPRPISIRRGDHSLQIEFPGAIVALIEKGDLRSVEKGYLQMTLDLPRHGCSVRIFGVDSTGITHETIEHD